MDAVVLWSNFILTLFALNPTYKASGSVPFPSTSLGILAFTLAPSQLIPLHLSLPPSLALHSPRTCPTAFSRGQISHLQLHTYHTACPVSSVYRSRRFISNLVPPLLLLLLLLLILDNDTQLIPHPGTICSKSAQLVLSNNSVSFLCHGLCGRASVLSSFPRRIGGDSMIIPLKYIQPSIDDFSLFNFTPFGLGTACTFHFSELSLSTAQQ
ncbi:hypothetical protein BC939DRAFT_159493 [Gamsiella multidivaricata]|uniref:uncharacterized protein n=1 Tax=Gamsiella multidivaricata TaxID=101098 RepID=UPI0022203D0D|nr:uncharacterized protein BC939DRAFT_159493 [Gamsiella multidivaricata]KAI7823550.1 hypothetical protein BC939DRAFT_159493 [Gamsiella multidivaricata]